VQVNIPTQEWTVTRTNTVILTTPIVINNQKVISYTTENIDKFTANTAPWVFQPAPVVEITLETPTAEVSETPITAKAVKAKKTKVKAKKKAAIK
jgi:hypothetical protein